MEKLLKANNGIETRHLAIEDLDHIFDLDAEALNRAFERHAPTVAAHALRQALERAELQASELDALFVCTCTGYLCPGVSSYIAEALGMRINAYLNDLVGMGCGAAIPALRAANAFAMAEPGARVAVVAVEICSAAFYLDDDPGVLISASLFGDGAACAILRSKPPEGLPAWRLGNFTTVHRPQDRELLRFANRGGKLRNQLARTVPAVAAKMVRGLHDNAPPPPGTYRLTHPGGRDVVDALSDAFEGDPFSESRWILRHGGNLSSPSILFALASYLSQTAFASRVSLPPTWAATRPALSSSPSHLWLTSFGAGFSAHACELRQ